MTLLNTIEYKPSGNENDSDKKTPLEEHAHFEIKSKNTSWTFSQYIAGTFGFENEKSKDAVLITQLPLIPVAFSSNENLAKTLVNNFQAELPGMKVFEEGNHTINNIEGYRVIMDHGGDQAMDLLYIFTFFSEKSAFAVQCIGEKNDEATKKQFEDFIKSLKLK